MPNLTKQIACPHCRGRGYISKCETGDYGNGLGWGQAWSENCDYCDGTGLQEVPMTVADQIRAMDDERLALQMAHIMIIGAESILAALNIEHEYSPEEKARVYKYMLDELKRPAKEEE